MRLCVLILTDYDGYSEDYWKNTELNRGIFLNFSSADRIKNQHVHQPQLMGLFLWV